MILWRIDCSAASSKHPFFGEKRFWPYPCLPAFSTIPRPFHCTSMRNKVINYINHPCAGTTVMSRHPCVRGWLRPVSSLLISCLRGDHSAPLPRLPSIFMTLGPCMVIELAPNRLAEKKKRWPSARRPFCPSQSGHIMHACG